jgi:DnaD/phage-associated family protein
MARPQKDGLDYFPHDVYASSDAKIEPLLLLYGSKGYGFYFLHLEYIYRSPDLEFDISDAETREVIQQKLHISADEYEQILNSCLKHKCFDDEFYKTTGKLTSNGVKKRAKAVIEKREKMRLAYEKKISGEVSDAETTHIKKSKVKKSILKDLNNNDHDHARTEIFSTFEKEFGRPLSPLEFEQITQWEKEYGPELIIEALKRAVLGGKHNFKYINSILLEWKKNNIQTIQAVQEYDAEFEKRKLQTRTRDRPKTGQTSDPDPQGDKEKEFIRGLYVKGPQGTEAEPEAPPGLDEYEDTLKEFA